MDKINGLPGEVLVKILSFVPTKVAVSSSVLSKRWKFLWMWLPKLQYATQYSDHRPKPGLGEFIDKNLPLHRALVIESLRLHLSNRHIKPEDIKQWIDIAVSRHCEYADEESLLLLLSICPVLEDLSVHFCHDDNVEEFTIIVPSLQSLSLFISEDWFLDGYEIDTSSLKYLKLVDWPCSGHYSLIKNMPKLREAHVDVLSSNLPSVIGSITSVKRLIICSEDEYGDGFVFNQLEHLTLCVCKKGSSNLLSQLLKDSPNLRVLDISVVADHWDDDINMVRWNQPSHVPECMLSSLQVFNWSRYLGRPHERDIKVYILKNARHLKTATIKADTLEHSVPNSKMLKELTLSSRASSTCQLVFVEDVDHSET